MLDTRALTLASVAGIVLQIAMVVAGHSNDAVKNLFAVGGMGLSLLAGVLYVVLSRANGSPRPVIGGAVAGGICALAGIAVSYYLGDVPASLLALGTCSSIVTGGIGGLVAKLVAGRAVAA